MSLKEAPLNIILLYDHEQTGARSIAETTANLLLIDAMVRLVPVQQVGADDFIARDMVIWDGGDLPDTVHAHLALWRERGGRILNTEDVGRMLAFRRRTLVI